MKNRVLLPFEENPYNQMFHNSAFPMGIIQGNANCDIKPWLASKYINCYYRPGNTFDICMKDKWFSEDGKLIQQRIIMTEDGYRALSLDYLDLLREMLSLGCYVGGAYNEEYIPGKWCYQKAYYGHDYLLIGYDNDKEEFYSVGYLADKKFQRFTIPYDCMRRSLETLQRTDIYFNFWKYNENAIYEFDMETMLDELYDYIHSVTSVKGFAPAYLGMQALYELTNYFLGSVEDGRNVDFRYTRGILEHKFFMMNRVDHLTKITDIDLSEFKQKSIEVYKMAERAHLLGLKYLMTGNISIVKNLVDLIHKMLEIEGQYLPQLYDSIIRFQKKGGAYGKQ